MNTGLQRVWCRRIHDGRATIDDVTSGSENQALVRTMYKTMYGIDI